MLSSLVLPYGVSTETPEETESAFDSTDARLTAMSIISFIPYFNWLSWVFAWLDTEKRRYAVYALAYLAPYLRYTGIDWVTFFLAAREVEEHREMTWKRLEDAAGETGDYMMCTV